MNCYTKQVTVLILAAATAVGVWPTEAQTEYTADGTPTGLEEEIRWRVNRGRFDTASENQARGTSYTDVQASAGPLAPNDSITLAARHHTEDMAKHDLLQHATVPGSAYYDPETQPNPWDRMEAEGYSWDNAAENIAAGYSGAEAAYVGWWNSTGHRHNMYDSGLREIGNGYYNWSSSTYSRYYTMDLGSSGNSRFFTDTLFVDANGNGAYDQGEGISGLSITLLLGEVLHSHCDRSTAAGSFAIPIQSIAGGTTVQVAVSNTTTAMVTLSIPRDYRHYTTVALAPGEGRVYGTFNQPETVRNVGLRDVSPVEPPIVPPPLLISLSGADILLSWSSESGLEYLPQWTMNFLVWNNLSATYQTGTRGSVTCLDANATACSLKFYRLLIRRP